MKILLFLIFISIFAWAEERTTSIPKRTIGEVHKGSKPEQMHRLERARVAIVDYDLLRQDFPTLAKFSNEQIDEWLLDQVAYISDPQARQTGVNTPIHVTGETRVAHRPPEYGRAIVFEMRDPLGNYIGLIDAKGTGSLKPGQMDHGNGLSTLGEAIREYNYENMIRGVLIDAGVKNRTVGSYGVIDAGFDVVHADGSRSRAGIYLRQAHSRPTYNGWLSASKRADLELLFWKYGIDPNANIQGTTSDDIYDFGHYIVRDDAPMVDPKKQIPFEQWGYDKSIKPTGKDTRWFYSKHDRPWIWAHETAEAFAKGEADRKAFERHYDDMVQPVIFKLSQCHNNMYALLNSLLKK
jgi:hypothetical protein